MTSIKITIQCSNQLYWKHRGSTPNYNLPTRLKELYNVYENSSSTGWYYEIHAETEEEMTVFLLENSECIEFYKES